MSRMFGIHYSYSKEFLWEDGLSPGFKYCRHLHPNTFTAEALFCKQSDLKDGKYLQDLWLSGVLNAL